MITVQVPDNRQLDAVKAFSEAFGLAPLTDEDRPRAMVLTDNGRICGLGAFEQQGDQGAVTQLFIDPAMRNMSFGDGLLRGLLNLMERSGVRHFYIPVPPGVEGFMAAEGIEPSADDPGWAAVPAEGCRWYAGWLPAFFQRPCKGGRR